MCLENGRKITYTRPVKRYKVVMICEFPPPTLKLVPIFQSSDSVSYSIDQKYCSPNVEPLRWVYTIVGKKKAEKYLRMISKTYGSAVLLEVTAEGPGLRGRYKWRNGDKDFNFISETFKEIVPNKILKIIIPKGSTPAHIVKQILAKTAFGQTPAKKKRQTPAKKKRL